MRILLITMLLVVVSNTVNGQLTNLRPDIGQGDCNVEFALTQGACQNLSTFCFQDMTLWTNSPISQSPECSWPFFPQEGVVFEGGCPPYTYIFNPDSPIPGPGNITVTGINNGMDAVFECISLPYQGTVEWTVIDSCGSMLDWAFDIDVVCVDCPFQASCDTVATLPFCTSCEDANVNLEPSTPCHYCDISEIDGYCSCTSESLGAEIDSTQFNAFALCDDGFVANNISWFSFTAGSPQIDLIVTNVDCVPTGSGSIGIQVGVYAACEIGECLASDNNCGGLEDKAISLSSLEVGELYYIYVDGCAGAGCTFKLSISVNQVFTLDEPKAISVETECEVLNDPCESTDTVKICLNQEFEIQVTHDDSSPTQQPDPFNDDCEVYNPEMDAEYIWSVNPAINDATLGMIGGGELITYITPDDNYQFPPIRPMEAGTFEICLLQVVTTCDVTDSTACVIITVDSVTDMDGDCYCGANDCDDTNAQIYVGAPELCDNIDNNCDGNVDEGLLTTYFLDADGDGFGIDSISVEGCIQPDGYVDNAEDCDDSNALVFAGASELCDSIDNNCNGEIDEGLLSTYFLDADGDGFGIDSISVEGCIQPAGYVENASDCDDSDAAINPAATEINGNGIDEDCDGQDGPSSTYTLDDRTLNIYPNPVSKFVYIDGDLNQLFYKLYDRTGQLIMSDKIVPYKIDLSELPQGIYYIEIIESLSNKHIVDMLIKY